MSAEKSHHFTNATAWRKLVERVRDETKRVPVLVGEDIGFRTDPYLGAFWKHDQYPAAVKAEGRIGQLRLFSLLAASSDYDVVNVGTAGTFVVRKPGSRAKFRSALLAKLPFDTEVMICDGRDIVRLVTEHPFGTEAPRADITRFVSILPRAARLGAVLPIALPADGEWLVRIIESRNRFVFGMYRRHMKTIGYLGQIDKLYGTTATTRN